MDISVVARQYQHSILDLFSGGPVAIFVWSAQQGWPVEFVSDNIRELLGYDATELIREKLRYTSLIHPDDLPQIEAEVAHYLSIKSSCFEQIYRLKCHSGCYCWVRDFTMPEWDEQGQLLRILGYIFYQNETQQVSETLQLAELVREYAREAIMITNPEGVIISVNPAFTKVTGYDSNEVVGGRPSLLSSGHHDAAFYDAMWHSLNTQGSWEGEIFDRRKNGEVYPKWLSIHTAYTCQGEVFRRIAIFSDITQQKQSEELIWRQANFDSLTNLPNRQLLTLRLEQEINRLSRTSQGLALIFMDLDGFKEINDTLGHKLGDDLLILVGDRLEAQVRSTDMVARFSGDQFALLLTGLTDQVSVEQLVMKVRSAFEQPFELGDEIIFTSVSFGVTFCPEDGRDPWELLKNADQAMFSAKVTGRGRYQFFTETMQLTAQRRMQLAKDLRHALSAKQLFLEYQPIVNLADEQLSKVEALIRWQHPELGLVSPAEFIPVAEETGLISEIGDWVFREAVSQSEAWQSLLQRPFQISINTSPVQYRDDTHRVSGWIDYLRERCLSCKTISLEITEGMLMENSADIENCLLLIRDAGMEVALDDFGTGYSSLSYLKRMDIDFLKIDRSFVMNLQADSDDLALCEAMIVMAHRLGIQVVAEGIETQEQKALLKSAQCDFGQGYFFSRPLSADHLEALFLSNKDTNH
ncbi:putative bifunctional diguanylate cyclase/phosphodiesterase [Nitrincola sp. A-D6]|uniref:putative bifunctional diguanylate cyclase/phosphodiesterase n=1 Tax=Nitrincola sp. A-D6 TaxID=1545442 RepID=UPI00068A4CB9|nr:GGDEF and EAL domain-containing protein [Nitrincola sp. A-D6]